MRGVEVTVRGGRWRGNRRNREIKKSSKRQKWEEKEGRKPKEREKEIEGVRERRAKR